jgi:peptide/nickel transport system permease protein
MRYVARRLLHSVWLLLGVSLLSFAFADLAPGDYYSEMRLDSRVTSQTAEALRVRSGATRPFPVRYGSWLASCARGDFGYSLAYNGPVGPLIRPRAGATLLLAATATLFAWLFAVPLGVWNAAQRGTWRDRAAKMILVLLLSVPDLLLALAALALAVATGAVPVGGAHLALPAAVLALSMLPVLVRHVRAAVVENMDAPFALSARAAGIPKWRLLFRHVLPAAIHPLVGLFGVSLGTLLSASLLVEVVMGWPGLGPLFLEAILSRDFAVVLAVVMLSTLFLIGGNLLADLLLYRFDPRIRVVRP